MARLRSVPTPLPSTEDVLQIIREERGLLEPIAFRLGLTRERLRRFISARAACLTALTEAREGVSDLAERKLISMIEAGDLRAILAWLSSQAKDRGYGKAGDAAAEIVPGVVVNVQVVAIPTGSLVSRHDPAKLISWDEAEAERKQHEAVHAAADKAARTGTPQLVHLPPDGAA